MGDELKANLSGSDILVDKFTAIDENSDVLYSIANSISDYTELIQDKLQFVNAPFSVKNLLSNLLTKFDYKADRKNVNLFTNIRDVEEV